MYESTLRRDEHRSYIELEEHENNRFAKRNVYN